MLVFCLMLAILPVSAKGAPVCAVCGQAHAQGCPVDFNAAGSLPSADTLYAFRQAEEIPSGQSLNADEMAPANPQKLTLLADPAEALDAPQTLVIEEDGIVLDLQGRTVTGPADGPAIWVKGQNVTIQNGTVLGGAGETGQSGGAGIQNDGGLTLGKNLKVFGGNGGGADAAQAAGNGNAAVINHGRLTGSDAALLGGSGGNGSDENPQSGNGAAAIQTASGASVKLSAGTITGGNGFFGGMGIHIPSGGTLTVKAGRVTGGDGEAAGGEAIGFEGDALQIEGGSFAGGSAFSGAGGAGLAVYGQDEKVVLSGGSFAGGTGASPGKAITSSGAVAALLGDFSLCKLLDGSAADVTANTVEAPVQIDTLPPQAYIDGTPYASLQEAIDGAADGAVIQLTQDLLLDRPLTIDRPVTLTCQGDAACTLSRQSSYDGSLILVNATGSLTLEGVVLDGGALWNNSARGQNSGISAQAPLAEVKGGSLILKSGAALQNNDNTKAEKPAAGGVLVTGGRLILTGDGAIRQNRSAANAGGVYLDGSVLQMEENATITGNLAAAAREDTLMSCVGGVQAVSTSQILLEGKASISGNSGTGGGITLSDRAILKLSGGQISGNRAVAGTLAGKTVHTAGGVSTQMPGSVEIQGAAVIWGNTLTDASGKQLANSNLLYLEEDASAREGIVVVGALDPSAKIGVTRCQIDSNLAFIPVPGPIVVFIDETQAAASGSAFVSDNSDFILSRKGSSLSVQLPAISYDLTGFITRKGAPASGAKLVFRRGGQVIAAATAQKDGSYGIETLSPGLYNLETSLADGSLVVTSLVQITDQTSLLDVALPEKNTSSIARFPAGSQWLVGGLDGMFAPQLAVDNSLPASGITQEDLTIAGTGGAVSLCFVGETADGTQPEDQSLAKALGDHKTFRQQLFVRMWIEKQVSEAGKTSVIRVTQLPQTLEIRIPFVSDQNALNPIAYRIQNGRLEAVTFQKNNDGEYLSWDHDMLVLHLRQFCPYAIGWEQAPDQEKAEEPETFDDRQDAFWQKIADRIRLAQGKETITAEAGDFTHMNWRVMSALRDCTDVSLKVRWNGGKDFTIPAGKAQDDNGLSYYPLFRLAEIYTAKPPAQSSASGSSVPPASSSVPAVSPGLPSSTPSSSSSAPEQSSAPPTEPEESRAEDSVSRPDDTPVPVEEEKKRFPVSLGVALAGAGGITALIVGGWTVVSHLRRRK